MTLEDNSNSLLLCGRVHAVTSVMNNIKILLVKPQEFIDLG